MQSLKRTSYVAVALILAAVGMTEGVFVGRVFADSPAGGTVTQRFIRMSDSRTSTAGATDVDYLVSFNPATGHTIAGMILQFCDSTSTPIVEDSSCTAPAGFNVNEGTVTINSAPGEYAYNTGTTNFDALTNLTGTWSVDAGTTANILKITSSGVAVSNGTRYAFTVEGMTNPNTATTFYARLITYDSTTAGADFADYVTGSPNETGSTTDDAIDYGGFALSTANVITVTARVAESMTFCVSGDGDTDPTTENAPPGPNCGFSGNAVSTPNLTIGHGSNLLLDATAVDRAQAWTQLSTNSLGGANLRMRNLSGSGGLNFGSNVIPAVGSGAGTSAGITAGTAAFGLHVNNSTLVSGATAASGTVSPHPNYSDGTNDTNTYGMDTTSAASAGGNVTSTYGDLIAFSTGPINNVQNELMFAATASNTTPAGIYQTNIVIVAVGTF